MYLMSAAWASLAVVLSALGAAYGWFAWRTIGVRGLLRGAGLALLPIGMWLTGTLRLVGFLVDWFAGWATGLVLSPTVVLGSVLVVLAVVLLGAASRMVPRGRAPRAVGAGRGPGRPAQPGRAGRAAPAVGDDDLADIEALLRRRGIT